MSLFEECIQSRRTKITKQRKKKAAIIGQGTGRAEGERHREKYLRPLAIAAVVVRKLFS